MPTKKTTPLQWSFCMGVKSLVVAMLKGHTADHSRCKRRSQNAALNSEQYIISKRCSCPFRHSSLPTICNTTKQWRYVEQESTPENTWNILPRAKPRLLSHHTSTSVANCGMQTDQRNKKERRKKNREQETVYFTRVGIPIDFSELCTSLHLTDLRNSRFVIDWYRSIGSGEVQSLLYIIEMSITDAVYFHTLNFKSWKAFALMVLKLNA